LYETHRSRNLQNYVQVQSADSVNVRTTHHPNEDDTNLLRNLSLLLLPDDMFQELREEVQQPAVGTQHMTSEQRLKEGEVGQRSQVTGRDKDTFF